MKTLALIGGTGLTQLNGLEINHKEMVATPYGEPSGPIIHGTLNGTDLLFIARHGYKHTIPPHKVNYRANIYALQQCGANQIIAVNAVGGIAQNCSPKKLVVPDQIIDYTHSREHTFYEDNLDDVVHIDFTYPYTENLRKRIIHSLEKLGFDHVNHGVYGATQGPRLETAAEIQRLQKDGCTLVGMTGMPEASLAREVGLEYASLCIVANWAAGLEETEVSMDDIRANLDESIGYVRKLLEQMIS